MYYIKAKFLSSMKYEDPGRNYGDCIIVDNGEELVIFDCGSEEHALRVEQYMLDRNYKSVKVVLSHNDADHFDGIKYLVDKSLVSEVYTMLLLEYKEELFKRITSTITKETIAKRIKEIYDNVYSLSDKVILKDIFADTKVAFGITIIGPDKNYALDAVAKRIDGRQSDNIDSETIVNAVSVQLSVSFGPNKNLLLTGDSCYEAIEKTIKNHEAIQLPHHGKLDQAEEIFRNKSNSTVYFVSDNTGDSNGGSSKLPKRGYIIKNTLEGDQECTSETFYAYAAIGSYFRGA